MRPSPSRSAWSKAWRAWHNGRVEQVLWIYLRSIWCQLPSFIDLHVFTCKFTYTAHKTCFSCVYPASSIISCSSSSVRLSPNSSWMHDRRIMKGCQPERSSNTGCLLQRNHSHRMSHIFFFQSHLFSMCVLLGWISITIRLLDARIQACKQFNTLFEICLRTFCCHSISLRKSIRSSFQIGSANHW